MSTLNSTTPSLESLLPKNVPTPEEVRANKKREEAQKVGIGQAFKDVANSDWLPMWAFRQLDAGSVGYYDPDFTATDPRYWPKLTEGLDPAYHEMFGEATNINMAMKIRQQALSIQESNRNIASLGGTGVAVRIVGNVFDPVNILLGMATGGGGFLAKNASRAERFIRGGAFGAAIAAPTEAYRTARDPLQDADDFMLNMGLAFGLGGIINSIPQAVRAEQAVRAGTATVEETPTSFIIRQKQLTEAPPRTPEPGLEVWQRPMQGRDFINRGERPTQWNDVEVPKMKNFDWRPDVADEATRFGQAVPMRSTGTTPTLARRQPLALPESVNVPDSTPSGQPLATGNTIRDPALPATPKYPSVDEMIAEVDRTGIDPYADVIVDPAKGTYEPIPDNVPIDPDTGEPMIDAVLAPENLDEVKFGDTPTEIPDPRTLEERLTSKIDEINRRRKNSPGIPRGDNTGGTILFAEMVDLVHELALRAVRAGVRGVDNLGKLFDELVVGKDPEIQKLRKDIIAQADDYVNEPELIEAKHRIARQRAEKADEIRGAKSTAKTTAKKSETSGNTPPPPVETPPGVGGTPKGPGDFDLTGREYKGDQMPGPSVGNIRISMGKALEKSSSRFINWIGEVTGERVLFKQGFTDEAKLRAQPNISQSASEATDRMFKSTIATLRKETLGIWDQYAKRENLNFIEKVIRDRFVDDFNDKIGIAIRAGRSDDPLIDAARKQYVKHFNDLREFGVKYGLPGFDKMPPDETYLWRVWDTSKIAKMRDLHTNEAIVDLLTEAATSKNPELNRAATREVMNYFLDAINDHQYGLDLDKNLAFTSARSDIQDVISALKLDANKGADLLNRAKGRMVIDENASITTKAGKLSVSDLLDNNAETIAHVYARNIIGAGHMQEVFRAAEPFFGQKIDSLGKLIDLAKRDGANVNVPPETLRYQVKKIEAISNSILGHRTAAPTYWTKAAIAIRGVNYLARAGKFAIAQIPEAGMVVANKGVQAAINNMPAMKDIAKNIFNGKFETRTAQEIQAIWALGTEPLVNHPVKRFDLREAGDQFLNYLQAARQLNKAQYWLSNISGMTYIQNVMQMWAGVTAINTWANMKTLPSLARLKSQGLDEVWGQKIIDNIRQHSTTETGPLGIRVKELNIHKWDKDVASKFIVANDKWSRKAVQQNNIALYSEWMTSDTGKVLTQFRGFAIQAYEKQFLQTGQILIASRGKDFQAWMEFILPCVMGGLAYYAQTYMSSIGRADREKYLDEMLDPQKVGLAAFNRGGASSILPMGTDLVADRLGFKKPFSYARSSGLESDPLLGNPTFDALVNVNARLFRSAIDPTYSSTQSDLRDLRKIIPGQNLPVIDNILNYYQSRMPKKRTENSNPW